MPRKQGLAALLVERGLFTDVKTASAWVMARKVRVENDYVTQPGARVAADAAVEVTGLEQRYVSRGGEKLEGALEGFGISPLGLQVLDAGASTGGFTDCLLARGAARVYAVDVGFGQLRGKVASDPRVVALERTNISDLEIGRFDPPLDLATADLSYLSVARSLPILAALFAGPKRVIHLVKPLFEGVTPECATDSGALRDMLLRVERSAADAGLVLTRVMASPILGSNGTVEFFGLFEEPGARLAAFEDQLDVAVRGALQLCTQAPA